MPDQKELSLSDEHLATAFAKLHRTRDPGVAAKYGHDARSIGAQTTEATWVRVCSKRTDEPDSRLWTGIEAAEDLLEIPKPHLLQVTSWEMGQYHLKAYEMTFAAGRPISKRPFLSTSHATLPDEHWYQDLRRSLTLLVSAETSRVALRPAYVERAVSRFIKISANGLRRITDDSQWAVAHADLNWANLVSPNLTVLDWEAWGGAPLCYDIATLWSYSLLNRPAQDLLERLFPELDTPDGRFARILALSERRHTATWVNDYGPLATKATVELNRLSNELRLSLIN